MKCVSLFLLIPSLLLASPASDARKAARPQMADYKRAHPACEWCGAEPRPLRWIEVHHIIPVSVNPALASNTNNMVSLCRPCHICIGHAGNTRRHVVNVRRLIEVREVRP